MAPRGDYHSTGLLKLSIDCVLGARIRRSWSNDKFLRVEKCLGRFLVTPPLVARSLKTEREERARQQGECEEQRKCEEEARHRHEEYNRKAQALQKLAQNWHESGHIRGFAKGLKAASESTDTPKGKRQKPELTAMAEFSLRHANYLDPLTDIQWMLDLFRNPPGRTAAGTPRRPPRDRRTSRRTVGRDWKTHCT
jgi:hypothetical protein